MQDGEERVIAYASKALYDGPEKHCHTKKKLMVAVTSVEHLRNIDGMIAHWLAAFEKYDYDFSTGKGLSIAMLTLCLEKAYL